MPAYDKDRLQKIVDRLPKMDFFQILNITADANDLEIKSAFRKRSMTFHPDRYYTADEDTKQIVGTIYKQVATAYNAIKNPIVRSAYIEALKDDRAQNLKFNPAREGNRGVAMRAAEKQTGPGCKYYELALSSYTVQDKRSALNNIKLAQMMEPDNPVFQSLKAKIDTLPES